MRKCGTLSQEHLIYVVAFGIQTLTVPTSTTRAFISLRLISEALRFVLRTTCFFENKWICVKMGVLWHIRLRCLQEARTT